MKLIILRSNLKDGLGMINRIGGENLNLPVLKNFLIETADNKIKLSATNLELAITNFISGKIIEEGSLTVPINILTSIINNLQTERINLEVKDNNLIIKADNYQAKIQGIKKEEFPIIPKINNEQNFLEISTSILKQSLFSVISAAQISNMRPELNGIFFDFQINSLKLAATDSFRLAEKTISNNQFKTTLNKQFKTIIPLKTIQEITRVIKDSNDKTIIYFDPNQVLFKNNDLEIISRLIDGEFPDYQAIIPESTETEIIINREQLINAIKLASAFIDRLSEIKITIKEKTKNIEVYSTGQGVGENQYLIPAKIKGPSLEIVFNWRFLFDGLKNLNSEDIIMEFNGNNKPVVIKSPDDISYFYVLMPIKTS
ncbi:MAG: DNA polymerase III subunit beta [Candidatus Paceibacterota bacterium]